MTRDAYIRRLDPRYVVVVDDRREDSGRGVGTVLAVGAVGLSLYFLLKNLGLGGRDEGHRDEGRGPGEGPPSPLPPVPPIPRDEQSLTFVMTQPTTDAPFNPMIFRLGAEGPSAKTYSLGGLIARVKAGGRADVTLKIRGDIRTGSADEALALIKQAGIDVWEWQPPRPAEVKRVSGNARGQYGGGWR